MAAQRIDTGSPTSGDWLAAARSELVVIGGMPFALGAALGGATIPRTIAAGAAGAALQASCGLVNSVADRHADATHPRKQSHPLVTGRIRPTRAGAVAGVMFVVFVGFALAATAPGTVAALVAVGVVQVYGNVRQKRSRVVPPPVMDVLFGATFGVPVLALASASADPGRAIATLALLISVDAIALNLLAGNVKDLPWDDRAGDRTTALLLGVTPDAASATPTLRLTAAYRGTALALLSLRTILLAVAVIPEQLPVGVIAVAISAAGVELWRRATSDARLVLADRRPFAFVAANLATFLVSCAATNPTTAVVVVLLATIVLAPTVAAITRTHPPGRATTSS